MTVATGLREWIGRQLPSAGQHPQPGGGAEVDGEVGRAGGDQREVDAALRGADRDGDGRPGRDRDRRRADS